MSAQNPAKKSVFDIRDSLLKPALTSNYYLSLSPVSTDFNDYLKNNNIEFNTIVQEGLQLACTEATLPGSSLATLEINNDYTGVTERHAYRRIYDDRIDLTFYVDTDYTAIRFFEAWIKFISNESFAGGPPGPNGSPGKTGLTSPNYFYTVRYPEEYQTDFSITKYERDYGKKLTYNFLRAYPISISSMPISYDSSSLLKCTVSLTYVRYYIQELVTGLEEIQKEDGTEFGVDTSGGLRVDNVLNSGNTILSVGGRRVN